MFKENNDHLQQTFLTSANYMNESVHKKLLRSWAFVFYNSVFCKIKEAIFGVLYCSNNGRPNFPVNILLSLEYIKHMFNYSDEELVEQFYFNYQIAYALGIKNVGELNLCPGTMYEFRKRLYNYLIEHPNDGDLIFTQFIGITKGFVEHSYVTVGEQRMDSSMISANIKNAGRLALAFDVIEQALKILPSEILSESMKEILMKEHKKKVLYKSKGAEITSKIQDILNISKEVLALVENNNEINGFEELKILKRFVLEQTKIDPETGEIKAKRNKEICADSLQSAYDTDATYRKKGNKSGKGYSVNIAETCSQENEVQFITNYDVKPNVASDGEFGAEAIEEISKIFELEDLYVDGAYCGKDINNAANEFDVTLHHTDLTGQKSNSEKINANAFELNEDNTVKVCPKNVKPIATKFNAETGTISAHFSKEECINCKLLDRCCIKEQVKANKFSTNEEILEHEKSRKNMINERKENTSKRAAVEGTYSELKSRHGLGDVRVRGINKVNITTGLKITACNFKRFAKNALKKLTKPFDFTENGKKQGVTMQI